MKRDKLYIFLLCVLNAFTVFNRAYGINVIIFIIPLLIFLYKYLKANNLIANRNGLLFMIPITILSSSYFIYDNVFTRLNYIAIPVLYILMYIFTIRKEYNLFGIIGDSLTILFAPFGCIGKMFSSLSKDLKVVIKEENRKKILSILIVSPIVLIILVLLGSADTVFGNLFKDLFEYIDLLHNLGSFILKSLFALVLFIYLASTMVFLKEYQNAQIIDTTFGIKIEEYTMKVLLTSLNVIYVVFDIIQINSLMLHRVSQDINYAEYARSGFFQLMVISLINIVIILLSKKSKETKYNRNMSLVMIGLTFIIIVSSFMRMYLYESAFGYTILRLGVYIILITEVILFVPTIMYILNKKINIIRSYAMIITAVYTVINIFSADRVITINNLNRDEKMNYLDVTYLENHHYDNLPLLIDFYKECKDETIKNELKTYFNNMINESKNEEFNILEFNLSKKHGLEKLKSISL
ncbi:MAG: DUF4173 domain-containing protein [Bacteroidales bacterium]|nr:DUF4173 domain-containing protein [Bacteroidales bacterium]